MKRLYIVESSQQNNDNTLNRIILSYANFKVRLYSYIRFRIIPLRFLQEILQYIPENGKVIDLGCGFGLFSLYFAENRPLTEFVGIDLSALRINLATSSSAKLSLSNIEFKNNDVRNINFAPNEKYDAVVSMDVLHHISFEEGYLLLKKIADEVLNPRGVLIIKDVTTRPRLMIWFTFLLDLFMNPRDSFYYRDVSRWRSDLMRIGFLSVEEHYLWDILPYPHILLIARMPDK